MIDSLRRVAVYPGGFHRAASLCRPAGASPTTRVWGLLWIRPIPYWKLSAAPTREMKPAEEHHRQTTLVPEWSTDGAGPPCRWEWLLSVPLAAEQAALRLEASRGDCSRRPADDPGPRPRVAIQVQVRFRWNEPSARRCCVAGCDGHHGDRAGVDAAPRDARLHRLRRLPGGVAIGQIRLPQVSPHRDPRVRRHAQPRSPAGIAEPRAAHRRDRGRDRKSTRLNSSHLGISYAVFCLKQKN